MQSKPTRIFRSLQWEQPLDGLPQYTIVVAAVLFEWEDGAE
jgi:hypothetical protein